MNKPQLLCLPFAGAGASFFSEWKSMTERFDVVPIQLPGREKRFCEPFFTDVFEASAGLASELPGLVDPDRDIVLFGHSLGAVLAYELTRALVRQGNHRVIGLAVSGSPDPWTPRKERATGLDDEKFLARVSEFAGYTHSALEDPLMRELLLPVMRADVEMHEKYKARTDTALDIPILMVRGDDDELISSEELQGWVRATSANAHADSLPGGHMYLTERPGELLEMLERRFL
ncbi:thioesterase [Stenotrophomonas maltophilia]|uniref:Thioesterase n=1 Tax=Stenotrophomonas maltophilia TaxID=40324 RepID=A0A2J0TUY3_STEMA|nr:MULTISPECIES: alpha/beta fold hydrolase [Stenotrophomonas]MBH1652561.1 thioesterase [Stenotrophomonas maltophilia]PJL16460.1 thioesterase [Stenotrophomonas maltophilia]QGM02124.1 thioesterase [Stenotrophomonas maltophilia]HDS1512150.1 thioesterase [Stenotrophomonas maltophilia]